MPANDRDGGLLEDPRAVSTSGTDAERTTAAPAARVGGSDAATDRSAIMEGDEAGFANQGYVTASGVVPAGADRTAGGLAVSDIRNGWDVYGSDGEKIGNVEDVGAAWLLVLKGLFFTKDIYVPTAAITGIENDRVFVNVSGHQVEALGWDQPPAGVPGATATTTGPTGVVTVNTPADDRRFADPAETTPVASEAARTDPSTQARPAGTAPESRRVEPEARPGGITVRPRGE